MERVACVFSGFQTLSARCRFGSETLRVGGVRRLSVRDGSGKDFSISCGCGTVLCVCGAGAGKICQPAQDSTAWRKHAVDKAEETPLLFNEHWMKYD